MVKGWWFAESANGIIYIVCIIVCCVMQFVNCGAFGLQIFNTGLNKQQRIKYNTKRIFGVVVLEAKSFIHCTPFFFLIIVSFIQIWYLVKNGVDRIPILSIVFAMISIVWTLLTKQTQETIIKSSEVIKITFDLNGCTVWNMYFCNRDNFENTTS